MIEVRTRGFYKARWELSVDGRPLVVLYQRSMWREDCQFELGGQPYVISKQRRREFGLASGTGEHARAQLEGSRRWTITSAAGSFEVLRPKFWSSHWEVHASGGPPASEGVAGGGGQVVGQIRRKGAFSSRVLADIDGQIAPPLQVFALYLVLVMMRRAQAAAAASS